MAGIDELKAGIAFSRATETMKAFDNSKVRYYPKEFGAKGGGGIDELAVLQKAIDAISAAGGGILEFPKNIPFSFRGKLRVKANVTLLNAWLEFISQTSQVYMQGSYPALENCIIDSKAYNNSNGGVIEPVASFGARIYRCVVQGTGLFKGIQCKTQATDTYIFETEVRGLGWGILWTDGESEQTPGYRNVDGFDYATAGIGSGLFVDKFTHSPNPGNYGDNIEVNTVDYGFRRVRITNCTGNGAFAPNTSDSRGIGIGAARVTDLTIADCTVRDTVLDAYHAEKCTHVRIHDVHAYNCGRALGLSHCRGTKVRSSNFEQCGTWLASYSNVAKNGVNEQKTYDMTIEGCTFDGVKAGIEAESGGFLIGYATAVKIKDCVFVNYGGAATYPIIQFFNTGLGNVQASVITGCVFDKGTSAVTPNAVVNFNGNDCLNNWYMDDNLILGYEATKVAGDVTRNRIDLTIRRNVTLTGDTAATNMYRQGLNGSGPLEPTGYITPRAGAEYRSTSSGQRYIANGTAWVAQPITTS